MKRNLIETSQILQGSIPTDTVVEELQEVLNKLNLSINIKEERQIINEFYDKVEKWQVVLIKPHEFRIWMQIPMSYYETVREIGFLERTKSLFTRGLILGDKSIERYADITSNTIYPLELNLDPLQTIIASQSVENKTYFSILSIFKRIENILKEHEAEGLSIYESPAGIVAMNNTRHYLKEMETLTGIKSHEVRDSMEIVPFSNLISKSIVGMPMDFKVAKQNSMGNEEALKVTAE